MLVQSHLSRLLQFPVSTFTIENHVVDNLSGLRRPNTVNFRALLGQFIPMPWDKSRLDLRYRCPTVAPVCYYDHQSGRLGCSASDYRAG